MQFAHIASVAGNDTKINIRQASGGSPDFYEYMLREDRNRDGNLSPDDFIPLYGKTAVAQHFPQIQEALGNHDKNAFSAVQWEMIFAREHKINALFAPAVEKLKQLGLGISDNKIDFSKIPTEKRDEARQVFAKAWSDILESEFDTGGNLWAGAACFDQELIPFAPTENLSTSLFFAGYKHCYPGHEGEVFRREYASIERRETYPQEKVSFLEKEFRIDIRASYDFTESEIAILHNALRHIRNLRPRDFSKMKGIEFTDRLGEKSIATAFGFIDGYEGSSGVIRVFHRFHPSRPLPRTADVGYYSEDWRQIEETGSPYESLFSTLLHELGHGVFNQRSRPADIVYAGLFDNLPGIPVWIELFAEDYRIFHSSGGKRVMRRTVGGWEVPHYEERLKLLKERDGKPPDQSVWERLLKMDMGPFPQF